MHRWAGGLRRIPSLSNSFWPPLKSAMPRGGRACTWGTHTWRLVCAIRWVYLATEYRMELTICEGPSMVPTIQPRGEVVVMDRWTPRRRGLQGGGRRHRTGPQHPCNASTRGGPRAPAQHPHPFTRPGTRRGSPSTGCQRREGWARLLQSTGINVSDVAVLQHPDRVGTVCKRVLGLPGDVVTKPSTNQGASRMLDRHGNLQSDLGALLRDPSPPPMVVPDINPWNSSEPRNYGPVPASLIMGRVVLRIWPPP